MQQMGIQSIIMKRYKNTTDSDHDRPVAENLLYREFQVGALD